MNSRQESFPKEEKLKFFPVLRFLFILVCIEVRSDGLIESMFKGELKTEVCALCLQQKELVMSHVIPKFKFRKIKGKGGQYHILSTNPKFKQRKGQNELQEKLLCQHCDTVIVREAETYLAKLLFGEHGVAGVCDEIKGGAGIWIITKLDFGILQRALLSILWRMHISSNDFFKSVKLEIKHAENLRVGILEKTPFGELVYPICCVMPIIQGTHYRDILATPDVTLVDGNVIYNCFIAGFIFSFVIGSGDFPSFMRKLILHEDGTWPLLREELERMPFFYEPLALAAANREG